MKFRYPKGVTVTLGTILGISVIAIAVIFLIIGLIRGFANQMGKGIRALVALIGSVALVVVLMGLVTKKVDGAYSFKLFGNIYAWATNLFKGGFAQEVTSAAELGEVMSGSWLKVMAGLSDKIYGAMSNQGMTTLGQYFGMIITKAIFGFVIWLVSYIVLKYLLRLIAFLLRKLAKVPVFKTIDKVFGGIWAVALTYVILISVIYTAVIVLSAKIGQLSGINTALAKAIAEGNTLAKVFKFVNDTNVLGGFLAKNLFGVDIAAALVVA